MTDWDKLTHLERSLLLGFLPLLGATAHAGAAVTAILILAIATLLVRAAARVTGSRFDAHTRWAIFAALAFAVAYAITTLAGFVLTVPADVTPWLLATGLTPLIFCGVSGRMPATVATGHLQRVCVLMLIFAFIREPLGSGTLFGEALWTDGIIPFGLLGSSAGAFIMLGAVALGEALCASRKPEENAA